MLFGERIKSLMAKRGISNYRLSKELDVSEATVGYWVNNRVLPNAKQLISLSEKFDVSIDYLLKGEEYTMSEKNFQNSQISNSQIMIDSNGSPVNAPITNDELFKLIQKLSEEERSTVSGYIKIRLLSQNATDMVNNLLYLSMQEFEEIFSDVYWIFLLRIMKKAGYDFRNEIINKAMEYCKNEKIDIQDEIKKLYNR